MIRERRKKGGEEKVCERGGKKTSRRREDDRQNVRDSKGEREGRAEKVREKEER